MESSEEFSLGTNLFLKFASFLISNKIHIMFTTWVINSLQSGLTNFLSSLSLML